MLNTTYPFALPPLPYDYKALEPYIDAETLHYHHDKHFKAYVDNLNKALEPCPQLHCMTLNELLLSPCRLPQKVRIPIMRNGGGAYNHDLYFKGLAPADKGPHTPCDKLSRMINRDFTSFTSFRNAFTTACLGVFGSGYAVLLLLPNGRLRIVTLHNQETPLALRGKPILYADVWEHAYYLKYKNLRAEYVEGLWNLFTYPEII